jgi:cytochrome c oxidase subunit 1
MAIIERPSTVPALVGGATPQFVTPSSAYGVFRRPVTTTGWRSWLFTVDHKKIGLMYGCSAMFFFLVGGIEALLIRTQLAAPDNTVLSAGLYNQMFTMHATTMIFLFVMPMAAALANYLVPLQIGARDVLPTAAGSCTSPTPTPCSRRPTESTSGRSGCRSRVSLR